MYICSTLKYDHRDAESPPVAQAADVANPLASTSTTAMPDQAADSFAVRIVDVNPHRVELHTPSTKHPLHHGSLHGAVTTKRRLITVQGELIANSHGAQTCGIDVLNQIWHTEPCPSFTERGFFRLEWQVEKPNGPETRFVFAQLHALQMMPEVHVAQHCITPFQVTLVAEDTRIFVDPINQLTSLREGFVAGLNLGNGGLSWSQNASSDLWHPTVVEYAGASKTPLRVTFRIDPNWVDTRTLPPQPAGMYSPVAPAINPCIWNATTGQGLCVPYTMQMGDTITIDGLSARVLVNGVASGIVPVGGFPSLVSGENLLVTSDETPCWVHGHALLTDVEWYTVLD